MMLFIFYMFNNKTSIERGARKWSFRETTRESCAAQRLFQFELESMRYTTRAINSLEAGEREGRAVSRAHYLDSSVPDDKGSPRCRKLKSLSSSDQETEIKREGGSERERVEKRSGRTELVIPLIRLRQQSTHRPRILSELARLPDDRAVSDYAPLTSI